MCPGMVEGRKVFFASPVGVNDDSSYGISKTQQLIEIAFEFGRFRKSLSCDPDSHGVQINQPVIDGYFIHPVRRINKIKAYPPTSELNSVDCGCLHRINLLIITIMKVDFKTKMTNLST